MAELFKMIVHIVMTSLLLIGIILISVFSTIVFLLGISLILNLILNLIFYLMYSWCGASYTWKYFYPNKEGVFG
jgi:hypothetical protein